MYRDSNHDGTYDQYNRVDFYAQLLVRLRQADQKDLQAIDLGSIEDLQNQGVGDQQMLIADRVRIENGQTIDLQQNAETRVEGTIVDVRRFEVGNVDTLMAIVEAQGQRQLVDLGPAAEFPSMPDSKITITLSGLPIQSQGHSIVLASRVWLTDQPIDIRRVMDQRSPPKKPGCGHTNSMCNWVMSINCLAFK